MIQRLCDRCKKAIDRDHNYFKITSEHKISYGLTTTDRYDLCVDCHDEIFKDIEVKFIG